MSRCRLHPLPPSKTFDCCRECNHAFYTCISIHGLLVHLSCVYARSVQTHVRLYRPKNRTRNYPRSLCGSQNENYSLRLRIKDTSSSSDIVSLKRHFRSQKLLYKSSHYWRFEVLFDLPVVIENGIRYSVDAYISGAFSWRGQSGVSSLQCSGVCFKFENSEQTNNGTSVKKGQFPEFLFCKQ